jgi:AraC-like DNA-binding protein
MRTPVTPPPLFHYTERAAAPPLREWIAGYWGFRYRPVAGVPLVHNVPPDGCTSLAVVPVHGAGPMAVLTGPWVAAFTVPLAPGAFYWGVRFQPHGASAALGLDPSALRNRSQPAMPLLGELAAALARLPSPDGDLAALAPVLDRLLLSRAASWRRPETLVRAAVTAIRAAGGEVSVARLAAELETTPRTLLRRFRRATGLSPKEFVRIERLLRAARALLPGPRPNWATVAAESGYADQPHLVHEFRELTGLSPQAFLGRVRATSHDLAP